MADWQNGLFGCFSNITVCIVTWLFPCYTAGKIAESLGEGFWFHAIMTCLGLCGIYFQARMREKIREQKGIEGSFAMDCILHWLCGMCALVQEDSELGGVTMGSMARN